MTCPAQSARARLHVPRRSERRSAKPSDNRRGMTRVERVLAKQAPTDLRWWREDDPHEAVFSQIQRIGRSSSARQRQAIYYACLYDDTELAALIQGSQAMSCLLYTSPSPRDS